MSKIPVQSDLMLHDHVSVAIDKHQTQMHSNGNHVKQSQVGCKSNSNGKQLQLGGNGNDNSNQSRAEDVVGSQNASPAWSPCDVVSESCVVGNASCKNKRAIVVL